MLWLNAQPDPHATVIGVALLWHNRHGPVVVALVPHITPALAALSVVIGTFP